MDKIKNRILQISFPKFWKRFLILALVFVLLGGVSVGVCFRTQISEGIAYVQQVEQEKESAEADGQTAEASAEKEEKKDFPQKKGREKKELKSFLKNMPITKPSFGAKLVLCAYAGLCCLLFGVYWLAVAAWLYQAAAKAQMNGFLWLLAGLAANLFAAILFLLVRSVIRKKCPACGQRLPRDAGYCTHCGKALYAKCPECGKACSPEANYCSACGHRLHEAEAETK